MANVKVKKIPDAPLVDQGIPFLYTGLVAGPSAGSVTQNFCLTLPNSRLRAARFQVHSSSEVAINAGAESKWQLKQGTKIIAEFTNKTEKLLAGLNDIPILVEDTLNPNAPLSFVIVSAGPSSGDDLSNYDFQAQVYFEVV